MEARSEIAAGRAMPQCNHRIPNGAGANAEPANQRGERHRGTQDPFRPGQISPQHGDSSQTGDYSQLNAQFAFNPAALARLKRLPVAVDPHGEGSEQNRTEGDAKRRRCAQPLAGNLSHKASDITLLKSLAVRRMCPLGV